MFYNHEERKKQKNVMSSLSIVKKVVKKVIAYFHGDKSTSLYIGDGT
jgi:hypothetical protein